MSLATFAPLDPAVYREVVRRALAEDVRWGDVTTEAVISTEQTAVGRLRAVQPCVLAGLEVAMESFRQLDPHVRLEEHRREGEACEAGATLATLRGFAAALLTAEQTAINFLSRLCGVATETRAFAEACDGRITLLDTRATTPTLRALEAYAVRVGGGVNQRVGLDDGVRVTATHVRLAGSVGEAVSRVKEADADLPVRVEVATLEGVDAALEAGADIVVVAGLPEAELAKAVARTRDRAKLELIGSRDPGSVQALARSGAEYVSVEALTAAAVPAELVFEVEE